MSEISIAGMNKAEVLASLYNASKPQGLGFMDYKDKPMSTEEAQALLDKGQTSFDYLNGRVMKINLSGDTLITRGYDRDNGEGAAQTALRRLHASGGNVNPQETAIEHRLKTESAASQVMRKIHEPTIVADEGDGQFIMKLGLSDFADQLEPKVNEILEKLKSKTKEN